MSTTTPTAEESIDPEQILATDIDPRTHRAVTGNMIVVPEGDASGLFDVYSATDGHNEIYTVDLREGRCTCPGAEYNLTTDEACKHEQRVKLALGIIPVPEALVEEIDEVLANSRAKYGANRDQDRARGPEPAAGTPASAAEDTGPEAVATDGGQLVADDDTAEDEDDQDEETETVEELIARVDREAGRLPLDTRVALHDVVVESYHFPIADLPDFDVYSAAIDCATDSVRALAREECSATGTEDDGWIEPV